MKKMTKWNSTLYDDKHKYVSQYGEDLMTILNPQKEENILDIGCGTGDLANEISKAGALVTGIDSSPAMIEAARGKYPHIRFHLQDGEEDRFVAQFHAVFSNAAIHWMKNQRQVVQNSYNALLPKGRFIAELGGANNVESILLALEEASKTLSIPYERSLLPWVFPTKEEMTAHLTEVGFHVLKMTHFFRPTPLVGEEGMYNWLNMFSSSLFKHLTSEEKKTLFHECERLLRSQLYEENGWVADYWRLRFVAQKLN